VPKIIEELSSKDLLVSEFIEGVEIDTLTKESQEVRNRVGSLMIELCFRELFEWKCMQTDPNPANYMYDTKKKVLNLIDFGAGREFETDFLGSYLEIIHGAYSSNKEKIMENSLKMGFLTGEENREMAEAHHTGVMIVGEPFRTSHPDEPYDFAGAGFTKKIT